MSLEDFRIGQAVGRSPAPNRTEDVKVVQELLRQCNLQAGEATLNPGPVNGVAASPTIRAIETFQRRFLRATDGRVDPEGATLQSLRRVTYNDGGVCTAASASARELVKVLLPCIGQKYVFGAAVPKENMNWIGPWDCAEFVAWGIYQVSGLLIGCRVDTAPNGVRYHNSYTGYFAEDLPSFAVEITAAEAANQIGTIALRRPTSKRVGHIAVCRGGGRSIEAYDTQHGVISTDFIGTNRGWTSFWRLRGLAYEYLSSFL